MTDFGIKFEFCGESKECKIRENLLKKRQVDWIMLL